MFAKPETGFDTYAREHVSPLVAWLASRETSNVSGYVMVVYGKVIVVIDRPDFGHKFVASDSWTVDRVAEQRTGLTSLLPRGIRHAGRHKRPCSPL